MCCLYINVKNLQVLVIPPAGKEVLSERSGEVCLCPCAGREGTFLNQGLFAFSMDLIRPLDNGTPLSISCGEAQLCLFSVSQHVAGHGVGGFGGIR